MRIKIISIGTQIILFLTIISCNYFTESSDSKTPKMKSVIFSEIFLDSTNQLNNWIELYNPTNKSIRITRGRFNHVKCLNCLPRFTVRSKEYLVICANRFSLYSNYGYIINAFEIPILDNFEPGGFFLICTQEDSTEISEVLRYGNPQYTDSLDWLNDSEAVPFSADGYSYTAIITDKNEYINLYQFKKSKPSPGFVNH